MKFVLQLLKFVEYQMGKIVHAEHQWTFQDLRSIICKRKNINQYEEDFINRL